MRRSACRMLIVVSMLAGHASAQDQKTYLYDAQGRMTGATRVAPGADSYDGYTYDQVDNRTVRNTQNIAPPAAQNILYSGEGIVPVTSLRSPDGRSTLTLQADGNLVLYFGSTPRWSTQTGTGRSLYLAMQGDGNLVLYDTSFAPLWFSNTSGNANAAFVLQDDCNLVIYAAAGAIWSSGTNC